ncbi:MAG: hypothetical protein ACRD1X_01360 [Vicinamibacteria bacterium]
MKKALAVLAVLAGFGGPLYAQELPVEVFCAKGAGIYKPICNQVKQAVKRSPLYKPAKNGSRYVVILWAETGNIANGDIAMSATFGAVTSDTLSQTFPYHILSVPLVFPPSDSAAVAQSIVDGGLLVAVITFEAVVGEINSYGASTRQLDEATLEELQSKLKSEISRIWKEQTD